APRSSENGASSQLSAQIASLALKESSRSRHLKEFGDGKAVPYRRHLAVPALRGQMGTTELAAVEWLVAQGESETLELKRSTAELKLTGETLCVPKRRG